MSEIAIDRDEAIANSQDAYGKIWTMRTIRGSSRYVATRDPYRKDYVIPDSLKGQWTSKGYLQRAITAYCKRTWDNATTKSKRQSRPVSNAPSQGEKGPDKV